MSITTLTNGRLCNQIFRNIAVSLLSKKHNLYIIYANYELISKLGIELYSGNMSYNNTIIVNDENYIEILNNNILQSNINTDKSYFQTKEISLLIYNYLNNEYSKNKIISYNKYNKRYNNNNDCCIHIRLKDVAYLNPGIKYYEKAINSITYDNLYIITDEPTHNIVNNIVNKYGAHIICNMNEIETIHFASTNKYVVLSHGSFSAIIGYLSFYSIIYYPEYEKDKIWYGDMFSIPGWNMIVYNTI